MDYYYKFVKYSSRYWDLLGGKPKSDLYKIGKKKFKFSFKKVFDLEEGTSIIFHNNDLCLTTKSGKLFRIKNYKKNPEVLQIYNMKSNPDFVSDGMEEGLLGLEIHNGKFYLSYTTKNTTDSKYVINLVIAEYELKHGFRKVQTILEIPFINNYHHGGNILFGPDGKLYVGVGDGGPQGDPHNEGQNPDTLRGKLIRIDVDTGKTEIVAMGLRNPWKFSFDTKGYIWIGDVGWNTFETVKVVEDPNKLYNFGWSYFEGTKRNKPGPDFSKFDPPLWEYPTAEKTGRSIIGGYYVDGMYIFGDFLGFVRAIQPIDNVWMEVAKNKLPEKEFIYSLGYDGNDIYLSTNHGIYQVDISSI